METSYEFLIFSLWRSGYRESCFSSTVAHKQQHGCLVVVTATSRPRGCGFESRLSRLALGISAWFGLFPNVSLMRIYHTFRQRRWLWNSCKGDKMSLGKSKSKAGQKQIIIIIIIIRQLRPDPDVAQQQMSFVSQATIYSVMTIRLQLSALYGMSRLHLA